ncbi:hypothetical protein C0991_004587, partial [Blastosporella zonata]
GSSIPAANLNTIMSSISALRGQVADLQADNTLLKGQVASLTGQVTLLTGQVASLTGQVALLMGQVASLTGQVAGLEAKNATLKKRVHWLEDQVSGLWEQSASSSDSNWTTVVDTCCMDRIRVREILNQVQAHFARLAGIAANEASTSSLSILWQRHLDTLNGSGERFAYTKSLAPHMSDEVLWEISSAESALRDAGDQAAQPTVSLPSLMKLISRADASQQPLLQDLVEVAFPVSEHL